MAPLKVIDAAENKSSTGSKVIDKINIFCLKLAQPSPCQNNFDFSLT